MKWLKNYVAMESYCDSCNTFGWICFVEHGSVCVKSVNGSYVFATDILNLGAVLGTPGSVNALQ